MINSSVASLVCDFREPERSNWGKNGSVKFLELRCATNDELSEIEAIGIRGKVF